MVGALTLLQDPGLSPPAMPGGQVVISGGESAGNVEEQNSLARAQGRV